MFYTPLPCSLQIPKHLQERFFLRQVECQVLHCCSEKQVPCVYRVLGSHSRREEELTLEETNIFLGVPPIVLRSHTRNDSQQLFCFVAGWFDFRSRKLQGKIRHQCLNAPPQALHELTLMRLMDEYENARVRWAKVQSLDSHQGDLG